jgi:hypothetical protein
MNDLSDIAADAEVKVYELVEARRTEAWLRRELAHCLEQQQTLIEELARYSELLAGRDTN